MKEVLVFKKQKTVGQAIIFYLFWTIVPLIVLIAVDFFLPLPVSVRYMIGRIVAAVLPFLVSLTIFSQKKLKREPMVVAALFLSLIMGWFAGIFVGMLPAAYLSTLKPKK